MCGIVGALSQENVVDLLIDSLKRLEYRGYDSSGIAVLDHAGNIQRRRAEGKLRNLQNMIVQQPMAGNIGIGHTRWATHGAPVARNAHPHATNDVVIVHNGIIENYRSLKQELESDGYIFQSETDSEVIAVLATMYFKQTGSPEDAVFMTLKRLEGAYAVAFLFHDFADVMFAARQGSPLAIGFGDGEMFLGSDAMALAPMTNKITYLNDGDWCILTRNTCIIKDQKNQVVERDLKILNLSHLQAEKEGYRHFMLKEIHEQPTSLSQTLAFFTTGSTNGLKALDAEAVFHEIESLSIIGCGTAYYAGYVAKYYFEKYAKMPTNIEIASEFRYRTPPLGKNHAVIIVSQSGETADSLAALRYAKSQGAKTIAVVNVPESTIVREADIWIPTHAGPEIGVASTKAFTAQMMSLIGLCLCLAQAKQHLTAVQIQHYRHLLLEVPRHLNAALSNQDVISRVALELSHFSHVLFMGRGVYFPLALEGALKLKEISYIHAEGYPAGELKHGPIALIDEQMPVVVLAPQDDLFDKTLSNTQEVIARGAKVVFISDAKGIHHIADDIWQSIEVPIADDFIMPFVMAVPLQLLAYYTAVHKGTDVDQPRNLAKSVTVE